MKQIVIALSMLLLISNNILAESKVDEKSILKKLNLEIAAAEDRGDQQWLRSILAPELSFRRANGMVVGKEQFLKDVKSRSASKTEIESVEIYGKDRAVVTCIVTLKIEGQDASFHNVRLFVREASGWKLLGWANERLAKK
jgi:hypothetical protein